MSKNKEIPSAEKIFDLLEAFLSSDFKPMTVPEVMKESGLKRNTADRLLKVFEKRGYVTQNDQEKWMLTPKIIRFSEKYAEFCLNVIVTKK